jgi:predicted lipid-binding transport protein (Tim44 family)
MTGSWWVEIVFLAMLAGFIALRLVSVLGRRTGHEQGPGDLFRQAAPEVAPAGGVVRDAAARARLALPADTPPAARSGLEAIAAIDPAFDAERFLAGARQAYGLTLEAFWRGDLASVEGFIADDVAAQFRRAIAARAAAGLSVHNRIEDIAQPTVAGASLEGMMAEVTLRFDAKIESVTRDADGRVVEGAPGETVATTDVWTFRRHVAQADPTWLVVSTDEED